MSEHPEQAPINNEEDAMARFLQYLEEHRGEPIRPDFKKVWDRELATGKRGGYAVYGDEADLKEISASRPTGELRDIKIVDAELPMAIKRLREAQEIFKARLVKDITPKDMTVQELEGRRLSPTVRKALEDIKIYMEPNPETPLPELVDELEEFVGQLEIRRKHLGIAPIGEGQDEGDDDESDTNPI